MILPLAILVIIMIALVIEVIFRIIGNFSVEMDRVFRWFYIAGSILFIVSVGLIDGFWLSYAGRLFLEQTALYLFVGMLVVSFIATLLITKKKIVRK
jgi:hypothetical protein